MRDFYATAARHRLSHDPYATWTRSTNAARLHCGRANRCTLITVDRLYVRIYAKIPLENPHFFNTCLATRRSVSSSNFIMLSRLFFSPGPVNTTLYSCTSVSRSLQENTRTKTLCTLADLGSLATSEAKCIKPVGTCAETTFRSCSRANNTSALARMYEISHSSLRPTAVLIPCFGTYL